MSTTDHAPPPDASGDVSVKWLNTADHAPSVAKGAAERFYEKTPAKPMVDTLTADLDGKTGVDFAKQLAVNYGKSLTLLPAKMIAGMGQNLWQGMAADHAAAVDAAGKGDYVGAIRHVINGAERLGNPLNSGVIQDTRESVGKDLAAGNLAGAAGTLTPWVVADVPGVIKAVPGAVAAIPRAAESVEAAVTGAGRGVAKAAKAGELLPTGVARYGPAMVAHELGMPAPVVGAAGAGAMLAPTVQAAYRGAKLSLADLAKARQLESLAKAGADAPAVTPEVMQQFFGPDEIAGSTPSPQPPSPPATPPTPASVPEASPQPTNLGALMSPGELQKAVAILRAQRGSTPGPTMGPGELQQATQALQDRIVPPQADLVPTPQPQGAAIASPAPVGEVQSLEAPLTPRAIPDRTPRSLADLASPSDLASLLEQLRRSDPDFEGPPEAAKPEVDIADLLQQSIDRANKAKKGSK